MQKIMKKKIYSGAYLLSNSDNKSQFGAVDAFALTEENIPYVRIYFGQQILSKMLSDEDGAMTINLSIEECSKLADTLKNVEHTIQLLINLSKRGKLTDEAYIIEEN